MCTDVLATAYPSVQAAVDACPAYGSVLLPSPGPYVITRPLTVRRPIRIYAQHPAVEIRQTAWPKPAIDALDVDNVYVHDITLVYVGQPRLSPGGAPFRGDDPYNYSAGVWANKSRIKLHNVTVRRFAMGVYLSPWNTATGSLTGGGSSSRVTNCDFTQVDHGLLFLAQTDLMVHGVRSWDHLDASAGGNPTHAVYGSGSGTLRSRNVHISDVTCRNNPTGHAVTVKYVDGGQVRGISADTTGGVFCGIDLTDMALSGHTGRSQVYGGDAMWYLDQVAGTDRIVASDVTVRMAGNGRAFTAIGDDCRYINITVWSDRDGSQPGDWDVYLRGGRIQVDGMRIHNTGAGKSRAIYLGYGTPTFDTTIQGLVCSSTHNLVDIDPSCTGAVVRYDPAAQRNVTEVP